MFNGNIIRYWHVAVFFVILHPIFLGRMSYAEQQNSQKLIAEWSQATVAGDRDRAESLLKQGLDPNSMADTGYPLLIESVYLLQDQELALLLLNRGAQVNATDQDEMTALMYAAQEGDVRLTKLLLDYHANPNIPGGSLKVTPLMLAAANGNVKIVDTLLAHKGILANAVNSNGRTALMYAAQIGDDAIAQVLLKHGADEATTDMHGYTALMLASKDGHTSMVRLLLEHNKVDINAVDQYGNSALILAAQGGHIPAIRILLHYGAKIDMANAKGETAFSIIQKENPLATPLFLIRETIER